MLVQLPLRSTATLVLVTLLFSLSAFASPLNNPLLRLSDFEYQGGFRLPASDFGTSSLNFSAGPLAYNPANHSLFIVGHSQQQAIAEFALPALVNSTVLSELQIASAPLQTFASILGRPTGGNTQNINSIGGLSVLSHATGSSVFVNAYEYYDAPGDNTETSLVIRDSSALGSSVIDGYFALAARAHAAGWISPIPSEWQALLGGAFITGSSSGIPIISRTSVGPSAFVFEPYTVVGVISPPKNIATNAILDFSLGNPLHSDLSNSSGTNLLWTHLSRATYGFIAPGTRTYVALGYSGGHQSGVCYKCTQNNGNTCGGYCANNASDYSYYYWLWDVADLLKVKNGEIPAYSVQPYEYGAFPAPFASTEIGGGSFDETTGMLYLSLQRADREQGTYANPPVIVAYKLKADSHTTRIRTSLDFNGDRKSDFAVVRSGLAAEWYTSYSAPQAFSHFYWGYPGQDLFLDIDINGDGRSDANATRARAGALSMGWFSVITGSAAVDVAYWGEPGDIPVVADFDADAKSDRVVFRPRDGTWWVIQSSDGFVSKQWGLPGDYPVAADYDGDGKTDFAIWRPRLGMWAVSRSSSNFGTSLSDIIWQQWGLSGDHPMPGDYDGDGKADLVVWRPSDGAWYVCPSATGYQCGAHSSRVQFGLPGDIPISADFDGDGRLDYAVWRPRNGTWYWKQSSNDQVVTKQWGLPGDTPLGAGIRTQIESMQ